MAVLKPGAGFGTLSGRVGNAVYSNTEYGIVVRDVPGRSGRDTDARAAVNYAMARANEFWYGLDEDQVEAWRAYARRQVRRNPATGMLTVPKAVNLFVGLCVKYYQVHGPSTPPLLPPQGTFLGDTVQVTVAGENAELVFTASAANQPGVLTELLAQRLMGPHNAPKERGYRTLGFVEFAGAGETFRATRYAAPYACATRFVESATGRATKLVPIGRATVTEWD
ncbi:MAG: hypothetical protein KIT11_00905 [Fimbriimonadaceae bacterium]|nr:hypothetical protein [Fimbriimonadaceae bacterium]QYK55067.1 MAG: hypothetical protein KF733_08630 [Fimbriimonadaceae bacterium]